MCSKDLIEDRPTLFQLTCVPLLRDLYSTMYSTAGHNVFQQPLTFQFLSLLLFFLLMFRYLLHLVDMYKEVSESFQNYNHD